MMSTEQLESAAIDAFGDRLRGELLYPDDERYDDARRVWNGLIEKYPTVVARCAGVADVITAVEFVREHDVPVSVKAGGHQTTGHAVCDGIVIDLSAMDAVRVDPRVETVRVQGGATWDQVNHETSQFGIVPPGSPLSVGVAGFTLGGGQGLLTRKHGLASDNLREVDVVTATGEFVTASEEENEDLFWAIRGGGGNFGIVTSFEFDCFDVSTDFTIAQVMHRLDAAPDVLRVYRDEMETLPEEVFPMVTLVRVPEIPAFPDELHGEPAILVYLTCIGALGDAENAFGRFCGIGESLFQETSVVPFTEVWADFQAPDGERHHWECAFVDGLTDDLIAMLVDEASTLPTTESAISIYGFGDSLARFESDATAYPHRDAPYLVHVATRWTDPAADDANSTWTREAHSSLRSFGTGGEYINNQTDDDTERVRAAFGEHYDRLAEIKARWDPDNRFSSTQNIEPAT